MKRAQVAFAALAAVGLVLAWNALLLSPKAKERGEVKQQVTSARAEAETLRSELGTLRAAKADQALTQEKLQRIGQLVPGEDGLAPFIRSLDGLAASAQVDWASLAPAAPTSGPGGSTINISINVAGTFFEILDYVEGLSKLERLVVVDSVQLTGGTGTTNEVTLQAALSGRIFSTAAGAAPAPAPAAGAADEATTAAAAVPGGN